MRLCRSRAPDSRAQGEIAVWEVAPESVQLIQFPHAWKWPSRIWQNAQQRLLAFELRRRRIAAALTLSLGPRRFARWKP
jgi:hypothetical protein